MNKLTVDCPVYGPLHFLANDAHDGHDRYLQSNTRDRDVDLLLFLDSRAISKQYEGSLAERLVQFATDRRLTYLLVCRPIELMTWATLVNFSSLNDVAPRKLITNMGFVDFTPKKLEILNDSMAQVSAGMGPNVVTTVPVGQGLTWDGHMIDMYAMRYGAAYRHHIERVVARQPTVVINTPLVPPAIPIPRKRPLSFFKGLEETAAFNRQLARVDVVELPTFDERLTYDAVHYTLAGNELIFERLQPYL